MVQDSTLNKGTKIGLKHEEKIIKPEEIHHILMPGELGAVLELIVSDPKTGKVTEHRVIRSKSFVQQFLQLLYVKMVQSPSTAPINIRDTTNNLRAIYFKTGVVNLRVDAAATDVLYGIIVGTGATAPLIDNYQIETIIPHGAGAGQMSYGAVSFGVPAADATTSQLTITRNFTCGAALVTVNEIALYCEAAYAAATGYFMIIRDVIVGGIAVPIGQTLTLNYREQAVT